MKKKLRILIIIIAFILGIGINANASEIKEYNSKNLSYYQENPLYASEDITYTNKFSSKLKVDGKATTKSKVSIQDYESNTAISADIRDYMIQRTKSFNLYGKLTLKEPINNSNFKKYIEDVIQNAMSEELANSSSAGDYLKWSWGNYNASVSGIKYQKIGNSYIYYMDLVFEFNYYTTYNQEIKLDNDIKNYLNNNIDMNDTTYEKICNIYAYITSNVRYDYKNLNDSTYMLKYTAYAAMENKTAVCQGYAALLYKMMKESGINDIRIITSSTHAWNIVKIGVMYYNLDSTWDEGRNNYSYFLRGSDIFDKLSDHTRDLEYCTSTFKRNYPTSSKDYDANNLYYNMNECKISDLQNSYIYTSKSIIPKLTVSYEDYILSEGIDYTIKYESNIMPGIAKIEINGLGYFKGIISKTFSILPAKMTGLKVSKNYTNQINLKWTKQSGVAGYKLYKYNSKSKKYECIKTLTANTTSYNVKKLSAGNGYSFKIRAYKNTSNGVFYGEYSNVTKTATLPNKVTISSVKAGSKKIAAKWKKVSVCTGYEIQYSTNSKFKSSKTKKSTINGRKNTNKTIKQLKRKQKYYVRIRAYTTVSGKKYYGSYSKVKTIKVK